jgi:hypothetical protein
MDILIFVSAFMGVPTLVMGFLWMLTQGGR